jgi:hypothetical protein
MFDGMDSLGTDFDPQSFGDFHPNAQGQSAPQPQQPQQAQQGMAGMGLQASNPKKPESSKKLTAEQAIPYGIAAGTGIVGNVISGHYAGEQAGVLSQIAAIKAQRAQSNAMFNQQIAALRAQPAYKASFLSQYGVLLIVGGVALIGLTIYILQRKKR